MFLSVIICTYNRADILIKCLQALEKQTLSKALFEVIIVDDGSTDETKNKVADLKKNESPLSINYIYQNHDGPASARNKAIKSSNADIVVFLNDDIIPDKFCLEQHYKFHQNNPSSHIGVTGIVEWHKDIELTPFRKYITAKDRGYQFNYERLLEKHNKKEDIDPFNFWTANVSLKRNFLLKYGLFDEETFKFPILEDIDLGHRLGKYGGFKLKLLPSAIGYHYHNIEFDGFIKRVIMMGKHFGILLKRYPEIQGHIPINAQTSFKVDKSNIYKLVYKLIKKVKAAENANSDYITLKLLYRNLLDLCFTLGFKEETENNSDYEEIEEKLKSNGIYPYQALILEQEDKHELKLEPQSENIFQASSISGFICPKCKSPIVINKKILKCKKNCTTYYIKNEIPDFAPDSPYRCEFSEKDMIKLLSEAEQGDYKKVLYKWAQQQNLPLYNYLTDYSRDTFRFLLPITSDSVILDVGCGWGTISVPLSKISKEVIAIDTTMEKLKFCKIRNVRENINNIALIRSSISEMPFLDNQFDFVIMHCIFNEIGAVHLNKKPVDWQKQALKEAYRVLKKNGYLFLSVQNCYGFKYLIGAPDDYTRMSNIIFLPQKKAEEIFKFYTETEYRIYIYSYDEYTNFLKENNFKNIKAYFASPDYRNPEAITSLDDLNAIDYYLKNIQNNFSPNTMYQTVRNLEMTSVRCNTISKHCNYYIFIGKK